jgi:hypothetical protein
MKRLGEYIEKNDSEELSILSSLVSRSKDQGISEQAVSQYLREQKNLIA